MNVPFPDFQEVRSEDVPTITPWTASAESLKVAHTLAADAGDIPYPDPQIKVFRVPVVAMCVTPTCDIATSGILSFAPLEPLVGIPESELPRSTLFSQTSGYDELFGVYDPTGDLGDCLIQFAQIFPVPRFALGDLRAMKLKSLSVEAHDLLTRKLSAYFGKSWGYAPNERVEVDGKYGCIHCRTFHSLPLTEVNLNAGDLPPDCPGCKINKRTPSWRLLRTPKKIPTAPK